MATPLWELDSAESKRKMQARRLLINLFLAALPPFGGQTLERSAFLRFIKCGLYGAGEFSQLLGYLVRRA